MSTKYQRVAQAAQTMLDEDYGGDAEAMAAATREDPEWVRSQLAIRAGMTSAEVERLGAALTSGDAAIGPFKRSLANSQVFGEPVARAVDGYIERGGDLGAAVQREIVRTAQTAPLEDLRNVINDLNDRPSTPVVMDGDPQTMPLDELKSLIDRESRE